MICIPITSLTNKGALQDIKRSCRVADCIELRMDLIREGNLAGLISAVRRQSDSVKIIVTCRRKDEAACLGKNRRVGNTVRCFEEKRRLLREAVLLEADFIDIELAEGSRAVHEIKMLCKKKGGKTKLIISYHNLRETPPLAELKKIFHRCVRFSPAIIKIVTMANHLNDNLTTLSLIPYARQQSQNVISLAMGDQGRISRIIAPLMGNYLGFATLRKEDQSAPGQFTVQEMRRFQKLCAGAHVRPSKSSPQHYVLLGNPVKQSLSPLMHNAALEKMGIDEKYSALCVQDIGRAIDGMRELNIRGASVTIPFKVTVMDHLDDIDEDALNIGAVNTIVNNHGCLKGYNTDSLGLMLTLKKVMMVENKTFVVMGAGGTARAAVFGIIREGGRPIIVNRTIDKGKTLANEFHCPFYPLSAIGRMKADCLINTTSVGMYPFNNKSPVKAAALTGFKYVMDVIYNPVKTKLLADAEKQGCRILSGADMFVNQGAEQLKLWTAQEPPRALMQKIILKRLTKT